MSMNPVTRYIRAFLIALWMTLRGEKPPEPAYPELVVWSREMLQLVRVCLCCCRVFRAGQIYPPIHHASSGWT